MQPREILAYVSLMWILNKVFRITVQVIRGEIISEVRSETAFLLVSFVTTTQHINRIIDFIP